MSNLDERVLTGRVVEVKDGDTFEVQQSEGTTVTVRLWGVDAPEDDQPYGSAATEAARRYIRGKNVRLFVEEDTDRYGRIVARVEVEGGSLSEMLVRDGLAWHHDRYAPNADELSRLEQRARNANRGLWSQPAPTPPWSWRNEPQQQGWIERYLGSPQLLIDPYLPEGVSLTALQYICPAVGFVCLAAGYPVVGMIFFLLSWLLYRKASSN